MIKKFRVIIFFYCYSEVNKYGDIKVKGYNNIQRH